MHLHLLLHPRPSHCQRPVKTTNVKAAKVVVAVTAPAAMSHAVSPVAKVALKVAVDALKPAKRQVAAVHAVAVVDAVVALTAQRRVKVNANVLTRKVVLWTPASQP